MVGDISPIQAVPIDQPVPWDEVIFLLALWLSGRRQGRNYSKKSLLSTNVFLVGGLEHF